VNRLAGETSPYLLQHAHNPVDWYPWGPDALAAARDGDKPIFLSIGYAACHWCHVMERETFEDEAVAADLRRDFVAIKVDREERPDLDQVYMSAVQALTGGGGWPMSVFLTPAGRPFYGGTYFPPEPRHGLPAFRQVLAGVAAAWRDDRAAVESSGQRLVEALVDHQRLAGISAAGAAGGSVADRAGEAFAAAASALATAFDERRAGWGVAPKFPQSMTIEYLLRRSQGADADPRGLAMARATLDAMAAGGIHDQLGGGFHRYSTDAHWLVPHFEQMLYDNAQLARVYLHAWQLTGATAYFDVATGALDFMERDLLRPDGTFAASLDADTQGVEGATFTWSAAEVRAVLADADRELGEPFVEAYGVTSSGNWEGSTILSRVRSDQEVGARLGLEPAEVTRLLAETRTLLLARRNQRPQPARDDKALAAWNGLAIAAFADAAAALETHEPALATRYRAIAARAADALLAGLRTVDGRLRRSWKDGRATADGVLEDHADLADGLLALYEATFDERWFVEARALGEIILDHFADPDGGFFDTADDAETLVARPRDLQDNAMPSGGAMATTVLLRLAALTGETRYQAAAERALDAVIEVAPRHPTFFAQWLIALDLATMPIDEVALIGDFADPAMAQLRAVTRRGFRPHRVLAGSAEPDASAVPLLQGRFALDGRPTAFVCRAFACRQPVHEPEALEAQLAGVVGSWSAG
jgi:uncharacterized protein YyaL (SSP411 family)